MTRIKNLLSHSFRVLLSMGGAFALASCLTPTILAEEFVTNDLSAGMHSFQDANRIADNSASYIQNFYTDENAMLVERNGFEKKESTQLGGQKPVTGLWKFTDTTGNEWLIAFSSRTFYKSDVDNDFSSFGPQTSVAEPPTATVNLGKIWFSNGTDSLWWFDGTSTGAVAGAPLGKLVSKWRNRIVIANISGALSTVRVSEDGDGTSWTIGSLETDPFSFQVGGANDGEFVSCIYPSYLDNLIIGRNGDLWVVSGFDQGDYTVRKFSSEVGCIQHRSLQESNGSLYWLSLRGVEKMTGSTIQMISEPIRDLTDVFAQNVTSERSATITTQSDFSDGTYTSTVDVDTVTAAGSLVFNFPDYFTEYRDGTVGTKNIWTDYQFGGSQAGDTEVSGGTLNLNLPGSTLERGHVRTTGPVRDLAAGTTIHIKIQDMPFDTGFLSRFYLTISSIPVTIGHPGSLNNRFELAFLSTTSAKVYLLSAQSRNTSGDSDNYSLSTNDISIPTTIDFYIDSSNFNVRMNDSTSVGAANGYTLGFDPYVYLSFLWGDTSGSGTLSLDDFGIVPQTTTFQSETISIGSDISAWRLFTETSSLGDGAITFQFNSSTDSTVNAIDGTGWETITDNSVPTVSTQPYAAFRAIMSTDEWDDEPQIQDMTISWQESDRQNATSLVYKQRYMLAATTSTASDPRNDLIAVFQRNGSWTILKGMDATSMSIWRDNPYFGTSRDTGYVYRFDTGNDDDGSNISSLVKFKSFDYKQPHREKELMTGWTGHFGEAGTGRFTLSYEVDRNGQSQTLGSANINDGAGFVVSKYPFPSSNMLYGYEFQPQITKSGTGNRLKLYNLVTEVILREPR